MNNMNNIMDLGEMLKEELRIRRSRYKTSEIKISSKIINGIRSYKSNFSSEIYSPISYSHICSMMDIHEFLSSLIHGSLDNWIVLIFDNIPQGMSISDIVGIIDNNRNLDIEIVIRDIKVLDYLGKYIMLMDISHSVPDPVIPNFMRIDLFIYNLLYDKLYDLEYNWDKKRVQKPSKP